MATAQDIIQRLEGLSQQFRPTRVSAPIKRAQLPQSNLERVLTNIQRTGFGGVNVLLNTIQSSQGVAPFDPVQAFQKGLSLEEQPFGVDVLRQLGFQKPQATSEKIAQGVGGFLIDVFADPLTYVGIGLLTKAGRLAQINKSARAIGISSKIGRELQAAQKAGKAIEFGANLTEQSRLGQRALLTFAGRPIVPRQISEQAFKGMASAGDAIKRIPLVGRVGEVFVKSFARTPELRRIKQLEETFEQLRSARIAGEIEKGVVLEKRLISLAKDLKIDRKVLDNNILNLIERPGQALESVVTPTRNLIDDIKIVNKTQLDTELALGLKTPELQGELDYFVHLITPEAKQLLNRGIFKGLGRKWTTKHASMLRRRFGDLSISEVNALAKEGKIGAIGNKKIPEFFVSNPSYAQTIRGIRSVRATTAAEFLGRAADEFGQVAENAPDFFKEVNFPTMRGLRFEPEIADYLNSSVGRYSNPNEFIQIFDSVQNTWKGWTLGIFPAYHTRNAMGNVWNNYLGGVINPARYSVARAIQIGRKGTIKTVTGQVLSYDEVKKLAKETGVEMTGLFGGEIQMSTRALMRQPGTVKESLYNIIQKPLAAFDFRSDYNSLVQTGFTVGRRIEDNARYAHFIDKLVKGFSADDAARSVKKFLFDYQGGLTKFERGFMKRIMPFYSWTRFNIPLQLEAIITQPGKVTPITKLKGEIEADQELARDLPVWLQDQIKIQIKRTEEGRPVIFPLVNNVPLADLEELLGSKQFGDRRVPSFVKTGIGLLSPFIKAPIEQAFNINLFTGRQIERFPGEREKFLGGEIPRRVRAGAQVLPQARLLSEIERARRAKELERTGVVSGEEAQARLLGGVLPRTFVIDEETQRFFNAIRQQQQLREAVRNVKGATRRAQRAGAVTNIGISLDELRKIIEDIRKKKK